MSAPSNPKLLSDERKPLMLADLEMRDLFAAAALGGFCLQATGLYDKGPCNEAIVERSYVLADLMLRTREAK